VQPPPEEIDVPNRTNAYWMRVAQKYEIKNHTKLTGHQLFEYGNKLKDDVKEFHLYREKSVLKLMFLHNKRRARLLCYFAF